MSVKHTQGNLDVFVGNANGRGLIRLEIKGTGQHIASMPRGAQSEADAMHLALCWDMHDRLVAALTDLYATVKGECPAILREDSGGDAELDLEISSLLNGVK